MRFASSKAKREVSLSGSKRRFYHWNILRVTGPLLGESTGHRWIPLTKASDAELCCFLWCAPEQKVEQTFEMLVIWNALALIVTSQ